MRAVVIEDGVPKMVERPEPRPLRGEAVVRVTRAGICGTDLEIARGYMEFGGVLGHEFVGIVEAAPDRGWIGRRVVGEINVGCGACERCATGLARHCPRRSVLGIMARDGAFAEHLALPPGNLHAVPDSLPDDVAVFTEPLAAAHEILEQVAVEEGQRALVLGDGRLGQLCAAVLARAGCTTVMEGRHPEKMARMKRFDVETRPAGAPLAQRFDLIVEATGSPAGLKRALCAVRPRGTIVLKSTHHGETHVDLASLVIDEVSVIGSRCGPFAPALAHLASDRAVVGGMITATFPLARAPEAFARASEPDALKVLLAP
jgi:alcohol dehydrogenase